MAKPHLLVSHRHGSKPVGARRQHGFTLVELMVVVSLIAILLGIAAPNLSSFRRSSELRTTTASFLAAVQMARAEALKRGVDVYMVPASANDWATGWVVFADTNWKHDLTPASGTVVLQSSPMPNQTLVVGGLTDATQFADASQRYIRFNGGGFPQTTAGAPAGGAIEFGTKGNNDLRRRVVLNIVGRVRICDPARTACSQ